MPTLPPPRTVKSVAFVVDATVKSGTVGADCEVVETESAENGVVVPIPRFEPVERYV